MFDSVSRSDATANSEGVVSASVRGDSEIAASFHGEDGRTHLGRRFERGALRMRLMRNAQKLSEGLSALGLNVASKNSPVVAVVAPDPVVAAAFWRGLLEAGVYVNLMLPPATPFGYSLVRASLCAAHTEEQIDKVIEIFAAVATKVGMISPAVAPKRAAVG